MARRTKKEYEQLLVERDSQIANLQEGYKLFLSVIAHDLRRPLSSTKLTLDIIEDYFSKEPRLKEMPGAVRFIELLEKGKSAIDRVSFFTDNARDISLYESIGLKYEIEPTHFNLWKKVNTIWGDFSEESEDKQITLENHLQPDILIKADKAKMSQAIYNVLGNGIRHSIKGSKIIVSQKPALNNLIAILFQDYDIIPILEEDKNKIFDIYAKGTKEGQEKSGLYGIGLYLTKLAVEAHGGKIEVNSYNQNNGLYLNEFGLHFPAQMFRSILKNEQYVEDDQNE